MTIRSLLQDVRYGFRAFVRTPVYAAVAIITLALGIGATTAIFSVIHPILIDALPYPDPSKLVAVSDVGANYSRVDVTFGSFREILARSRSFDALAVMKPWQPTIVGSGQAERLDGQRVSADYFRTLGVEPLVGRGFGSMDDRPNGATVVVLSDGMWRRRFGADPGVVGQAITLDDAAATVVGVMPSAFEDALSPSTDIWAPLQYDTSLPTDGREWGHHLTMIGRLRTGVDLDHARGELGAIAAAGRPDFPRPPWAALRNGLLVTPLQDNITRDVKPALLAVAGAVALLLMIAGVNVTNLQLGRAAERRAEFAMRAALGAGRGRLVQQLVTESLLLASAGGLVGLLVADFGVRALLALAPSTLPRLGAIQVDVVAFGVAFATAAMVGLMTGAAPALYASRRDLASGLQRASARTGGGHHSVRRTLVVAEIALALVLLVGAGLLTHSLARLFAIDPGYIPAHVATMQVQTVGRRLEHAQDALRFFDDALTSVSGVPGVETAAFASQMPLTGSRDSYGVRIQRSPTGQADADGGAFRYAVTPGFFETMGLRVLRGRAFDSRDAADAPDVALVSESLARGRLGDTNPIGQWVRIGPTRAPWRRIVGVVANMRQTSLAVEDADAVYVPFAQATQFGDRAMWLVVRARGDAAALTPPIENAVWMIDRDQPIVRVATMDELVARSAGQRTFALLLFEAFAFVALVLAAVGVYGVLATSVNERTREIGVRAALGATRRDILMLVVGQAALLTGLGVVIGLAVAAVSSRSLATLLFGVSRLDPITYAGVVGVLAFASVLACCLPAWRAVRVDPAVALRNE